jgi:hypothetical protein
MGFAKCASHSTVGTCRRLLASSVAIYVPLQPDARTRPVYTWVRRSSFCTLAFFLPSQPIAVNIGERGSVLICPPQFYFHTSHQKGGFI